MAEIQFNLQTMARENVMAGMIAEKNEIIEALYHELLAARRRIAELEAGPGEVGGDKAAPGDPAPVG